MGVKILTVDEPTDYVIFGMGKGCDDKICEQVVGITDDYCNFDLRVPTWRGTKDVHVECDGYIYLIKLSTFKENLDKVDNYDLIDLECYEPDQLLAYLPDFTGDIIARGFHKGIDYLPETANIDDYIQYEKEGITDVWLDIVLEFPEKQVVEVFTRYDSFIKLLKS